MILHKNGRVERKKERASERTIRRPAICRVMISGAGFFLVFFSVLFCSGSYKMESPRNRTCKSESKEYHTLELLLLLFEAQVIGPDWYEARGRPRKKVGTSFIWSCACTKRARNDNSLSRGEDQRKMFSFSWFQRAKPTTGVKETLSEDGQMSGNLLVLRLKPASSCSQRKAEQMALFLRNCAELTCLSLIFDLIRWTNEPDVWVERSAVSFRPDSFCWKKVTNGYKADTDRRVENDVTIAFGSIRLVTGRHSTFWLCVSGVPSEERARERTFRYLCASSVCLQGSWTSAAAFNCIYFSAFRAHNSIHPSRFIVHGLPHFSFERWCDASKFPLLSYCTLYHIWSCKNSLRRFTPIRPAR